MTGIVPSLFWLWFWLREDRVHPEPRSLIARCFITGMCVVIVAALGERYVASILSNQTSLYIIWAVLEETLKFIALLFVALPSKANDEPIDPMVYAITIALGFAALENALFILGPLSDGAISTGLITGSMRFMGATLVHVICSALTGFAIGLAYYHGKYTKSVMALLGLGIAIAIHAIFNISIVNTSSSGTLQVFAWVWGAVVILIVLFEEVKAVRLHSV